MATIKKTPKNEDSIEPIDPNQPTKPVKPIEDKWQHYKSSRIALNMITFQGHKINFANYQFMTQDPEQIDYLDNEIANGQNVIEKGELLTKEADPMAKLRKEVLEQAIAEGTVVAAPEDSKTGESKAGILSSAGVTNSANSNAG